MELMFQEIEHALKCGLYYSSIALVLTLPDICAALASSDGLTSGEKYKKWVQANLCPKYSSITPEDFYSLRNGVIHQGKFGHAKMQYSRIIFTIPNAQNNIFRNNIINDALNLDAVMFCNDLLAAAREWFSQNQTDAAVMANLPRLVQFRPMGISPYMVGMPLIS